MKWFDERVNSEERTALLSELRASENELIGIAEIHTGFYSHTADDKSVPCESTSSRIVT